MMLINNGYFVRKYQNKHHCPIFGEWMMLMENRRSERVRS